eukprot:1055308_1
MPNLKRLSISTNIMHADDDNGDLINVNDILQHTQLNTLNLTVTWSARYTINAKENLTKYVNSGLLQFLFSTFIGITEFEYDFDRPWLVSPLPGTSIDWDDVLS